MIVFFGTHIYMYCRSTVSLIVHVNMKQCVCLYACIDVLRKCMYFQQILYLLDVNKHYGYGYVSNLAYQSCQLSHRHIWSCKSQHTFQSY